MHPTIQSASESLGIDLPNLREAAEFSELALTSIREMIHERVPPLDQECLDVIVFGSLARHEAMPGSDLDYVVAVHRLPEDVRRTRSLMEAIVEAQQQSLLKNPGRSRMFGTVMSVGSGMASEVALVGKAFTSGSGNRSMAGRKSPATSKWLSTFTLLFLAGRNLQP